MGRQINNKIFILTFMSVSFGCSHLFYYPSKVIYFPPDKNGFVNEDVYFHTTDGVKLHAWFFKAQDISRPLGTIILFHGNGENLSSHYASLVWITRLGYNLFIFDYRGYGQSDAVKINQKGTYLDALAAYEKAFEYYENNGKGLFIVYGQSLGGVIAMNAFKDFRHKEKVDLFVADSTFLSYKDVAWEKMTAVWFTWPFSPLTAVLISDAYWAKDAVAEIGPRLLVIHDKHDPIVGFDNGLEIFKLAKCEKEFWELDKGRHTAVFAYDTFEYRNRFLNFLGGLRKTEK